MNMVTTTITAAARSIPQAQELQRHPPFLLLAANCLTPSKEVTTSSASADQSLAVTPRAASPSASIRGDALYSGVRASKSPSSESTHITSSSAARGDVPSPGITSPASAMGAAVPEAGDDGVGDFNDGEKEWPRRARKRNIQSRRRSSFIHTLLATPGCVLVIDNLEVDAQPIDLLGQLMKFGDNKERIHSVHIPPPYPELNRAVGYVVFINKESADAAATLLTQNFVVSTRGRPWIVTRRVQKLNEEDFGFPTISAFQGETQDGDADSFGGLKVVTDKQEVEYMAAKKRRLVFEQHRRQAQVMFQRHAQEEQELEDNPDLSLYH